MLNKTGLTNRVVLYKDMSSGTSKTFLTDKLNTSNLAYMSGGYGSNNGSSTVVLINVGGFDDQKITARLKYVAATSSPNEEIGVMLRLQSFDSPSQNYYYARVNGGLAQITKVFTGSFTTLTQTAFALGQNTFTTIEFSVVGNVLSASFAADGGDPATVQLTTTDSEISGSGIMGFRSLTSTVVCEEFTAEQIL